MVAELELNQTQIQRIIQSKAFRTSEVHRNLLQYLAEKSLSGAADSLKEYTVGLDVFAKPASYDPRQESVVRMHVARLRQKLAEYYRTEGANDPVVVEVPKGGFRVTFETRPVAPEKALDPTAPPISEAGVPSRRKERILAALLATAAVCALALGILAWRWKPAPPTAAPELRQLWGSILETNRPLMICLATSNGSAGGSANDGTASGAFLLGQFLAHRKDNVLLTRSDQLAMPEVLMDNVIFLGPVSGNRQVEALAKDLPLILEADGIRNLRPRTGEPAFIPDQTPASAKDVDEAHALVSHVPGLYGNGDILYLSGNRISSTLAAVRALTDPALARPLIAKLKAGNGTVPRFYQMVLRVQSMDSMPIEVSYMFHRDLTSQNKP
ncbi:MAG TPA: hypothetical protein VFW44_14435 [Bryobacteraceae bacterium]|nr:hypothetical protein [Bryobacteraceae bacterium]